MGKILPILLQRQIFPLQKEKANLISVLLSINLMLLLAMDALMLKKLCLIRGTILIWCLKRRVFCAKYLSESQSDHLVPRSQLILLLYLCFDYIVQTAIFNQLISAYLSSLYQNCFLSLKKMYE